MDLTQLMNQAKKMQEDMELKEEKLKGKSYCSTSGGGAVRVCITGDFVVQEITIEEDLLSVENKEMLIDLLQIAINQSLASIDEEKKKNINDASSNLNLEGLF